MIPTRADTDDAWRRVALTPDGKLIYRDLGMVAMAECLTTEVGALLKFEGRRSLALEKKRLMDEELSKTEPRSAPGDRHDPNQPAVVRPREPAAAGGQRGTRRRVEPYPDADKA